MTITRLLASFSLLFSTFFFAVAVRSEPQSASSAGSAIDPCNPGGPTLVTVSPQGIGEAELGQFKVGQAGEDTRGDSDSSRPSLPRIDERQVFALTFNCPVREDSLLAKAQLSVSGIKEPIRFDLVTGSEREALLCKLSEAGRENVVIVRPRMALPVNSQVTLSLNAGVRSVSGVVTTQAQIFGYQVRPAFSLFTRCEHTYASGACDPYLPIYLVGTNTITPRPWNENGIFGEFPLVSSDGVKAYGERSVYAEGGQVLPAIRFKPPFKPGANLVVQVPEDLVDSSGRKLAQPTTKFPVVIGPVAPMVRFNSTFGIVELAGNGMLPVTVRNIDPALGIKATGSGAELATSSTQLPALGGVFNSPEKVLYWLGKVQARYRDIEKNTTSIFAAVDAATAKALSNPNTPPVQESPAVATTAISIPKPAGAAPFEVVGIPFTKPGFYVLELESRAMGEALRGKGESIFFPTTALVTNLAVHFKWGRDSSLGWVTDLQTGQPVAQAEVSVAGCDGVRLATGVTDSNGIAKFGKLPRESEAAQCGEWVAAPMETPGVKYPALSPQVLVVSAKKGEDFSFVLSNWTEGIEPWRYGLSYDYGWSPSADVFQAVADRTLLRRGETASFKVFARRKTSDGFDFSAPNSLPAKLTLTHSGSNEEIEIALAWNANGSAVGEWPIPKNAKLGEYSARYVSASGQTSYGPTLLSVLDYRVPLAKGVITVNSSETISGAALPVNLAVSYLSGGAASELPVTLSYQVQPDTFAFSGVFEDFLFGRDEVLNLASDPYRRESDGQSYAGLSADAQRPVVKSVNGTLDARGALSVTLNDITPVTRPSKLLLELEYRDPNGEVQTSSQRIPWLPSPWLVGIKTSEWANLQRGFSFDVAVVTGLGTPVASAPVVVSVYNRETFTHRKRLVGATFGYDNVVQNTDAGVICRGNTDAKGIIKCKTDLQLDGALVLEAVATDPQQRKSLTSQQVFVGGDPQNWFAQAESDRIDLIPERKRYEPGETARFQVRTPFKEATALVTVEREGILESFIQTISRANPVLELPVKDFYGPNVVVSALLVRGRIGEAKATAIFDPGKPAFKLGIAEIDVGVRKYELKVDLKSDKQVYQTREKVSVSVGVRTASGAALPQGTEVAIFGVDAGLLQLKSNQTVALLDAMMERRPTTVLTAVNQGLVVGKRHYGLKSLPFGGGGGSALTRELFDTLLYWNPRVLVDGSGKAQIEIPLNDSVTSFKIFAVASAGASLFGSGSTEIRATKDFALFAGTPPTIRSGDSFSADFTVQNNSAQKAALGVSFSALDQDGNTVLNEVLPAADYEAATSRGVSFKIVVPASATEISYKASLTGGERILDTLAVKQRVTASAPATVLAARFGQVTKISNGVGELKLPITLSGVEAGLPEGATIIPGTRSAQISVSRTIADTSGVKRYMSEYPFACLEQKVSKAISLEDDSLWEKITADLSGYLDQNGFAKFFTSQSSGDEVLTAYLLSAAAASGRVVPDAPRLRMLDALKKFVSGKIIRGLAYPISDTERFQIGSKLTFADVELRARKIAALAALSWYGLAEEAQVNALWRDLAELPTAALVDLALIVNRSEDSVSGALSKLQERKTELDKIFAKRLLVTQARAQFVDDDKSYNWQLSSGDLTVVKYIAALLQKPKLSAAELTLLPKLVQGAISRQSNGHWDTTLANVWGVMALREFTEKFEGESLSGESTLTATGAAAVNISWDDAAKPNSDNTEMAVLDDGEQDLTVSHKGAGKPWVNVLLSASRKLERAVGPGYGIKKVITPIQQKVPGVWSVGDVAQIELTIDAKYALSWVVVDDPIPSGATVLGSGLGNQSELLGAGDSVGGESPGRAWLAFEERSFLGYRAYFSWVEAGKHTVTYRIRLSTAGDFVLPASRVEAMYMREHFGEAPNGEFRVQK